MPFLYANNFIDVLKKKHASGGYREMVRYISPRSINLGKQVLAIVTRVWSCICVGYLCGSM